MTWGGKQGFQTPIATDSFLVDGVGALGTSHTERGLTYVEVELSGHMYGILSSFCLTSFGSYSSLFFVFFHRVPQFSPVAAFQVMQYLMGFRATP